LALAAAPDNPFLPDAIRVMGRARIQIAINLIATYARIHWPAGRLDALKMPFASYLWCFSANSGLATGRKMSVLMYTLNF
jgi:hypothetical protein